MLKKFRFVRWQIAYRTSAMEKFELIPNPQWGWAADPFVIEHCGKIYIFAELYLYKSERNGVIGYCTYEKGKFSDWTVSMDEHWHLSYPNVFRFAGKIYMCPESYQCNEVSIYELVEFPNHWMKVKVLLENGKYVDSTFLCVAGEKYMFSFKPTFKGNGGDLLMYHIDRNYNVSEPGFITDDVGKARPGGNFILHNDKIIRVSQDSTDGYGYGLVFSEVDTVWPQYAEHEIERVTVKDINGDWSRTFTGIHTYNRCDKMEVIDLRYTKYSVEEYMARKRVRKVFLNKYC